MARVPYVVSDELHLQMFDENTLNSLLKQTGFDVLQVEGIRNRLKCWLKITNVLM